jgi:hypothetical protein
MICLCKSVDYVPKTGKGWKRVQLLSNLMRRKSPELSLFILSTCVISHGIITNKILKNNHVKIIFNIMSNYSSRKNSEKLISIDISDLDPRCGDNTLYKFAKLLDDFETCEVIKKISIEKYWIEKQVLITNFENLIGPSDISTDIYNHVIKYI